VKRFGKERDEENECWRGCDPWVFKIDLELEERERA